MNYELLWTLLKGALEEEYSNGSSDALNKVMYKFILDIMNTFEEKYGNITID